MNSRFGHDFEALKKVALDQDISLLAEGPLNQEGVRFEHLLSQLAQLFLSHFSLIRGRDLTSMIHLQIECDQILFLFPPLILSHIGGPELSVFDDKALTRHIVLVELALLVDELLHVDGHLGLVVLPLDLSGNAPLARRFLALVGLPVVVVVIFHVFDVVDKVAD